MIPAIGIKMSIMTLSLHLGLTGNVPFAKMTETRDPAVIVIVRMTSRVKYVQDTSSKLMKILPNISMHTNQLFSSFLKLNLL